MREQLEQKDESPFSCQCFGTTGVMFCLFEAKIMVARQRPTGKDPTSPRLAAPQKELKTLTSMCACMLKTVLFTAAKSRNNPHVQQQMTESTNFDLIMEYDSALKRE